MVTYVAKSLQSGKFLVCSRSYFERPKNVVPHHNSYTSKTKTWTPSQHSTNIISPQHLIDLKILDLYTIVLIIDNLHNWTFPVPQEHYFLPRYRPLLYRYNSS